MRYKCPKCGSDLLAVCVLAWADLIQRDTGHLETNLIADAEQEWTNEESPMRCTVCCYEDIADNFRDFEREDKLRQRELEDKIGFNRKDKLI